MEEPEERSVPVAATGDPVSGPAVERVANYAAAIYGSILVAALVSTLDEEDAAAGALAVAVLTTMVVFWLAHVWADVVAERLETGERLSSADLRRLAHRQWPMIEAATAPVAALVLAWTGVLSLDLAVWLALSLSIVQLAAWGMVVGFRTAATWPLALLSGAVNATFGLAIVMLKALVH